MVFRLEKYNFSKGRNIDYDKSHLNSACQNAIMAVQNVIGNVIDNNGQLPCLLKTKSQ